MAGEVYVVCWTVGRRMGDCIFAEVPERQVKDSLEGAVACAQAHVDAVILRGVPVPPEEILRVEEEMECKRLRTHLERLQQMRDALDRKIAGMRAAGVE